MPILPAIANLTYSQLGFIFLIVFSLALFANFIRRFGVLSKLKFTRE